jgi:hypothetical protein
MARIVLRAPSAPARNRARTTPPSDSAARTPSASGPGSSPRSQTGSRRRGRAGARAAPLDVVLRAAERRHRAEAACLLRGRVAQRRRLQGWFGQRAPDRHDGFRRRSRRPARRRRASVRRISIVRVPIGARVGRQGGATLDERAHRAPWRRGGDGGGQAGRTRTGDEDVVVVLCQCGLRCRLECAGTACGRRADRSIGGTHPSDVGDCPCRAIRDLRGA